LIYVDESGHWPKLSQLFTAVAVVATVVAVTAVAVAVVATAPVSAPVLAGVGTLSSGAVLAGATTVAVGSFKVATVSASAVAVSYGAESIYYAKKKYTKQPNPNQRKGANKRQPNPDAPGKNETHSDLSGGENHSQNAKGSHGLPKGFYGRGSRR